MNRLLKHWQMLQHVYVIPQLHYYTLFHAEGIAITCCNALRGKESTGPHEITAIHTHTW